jgi:hypothetical protein
MAAALSRIAAATLFHLASWSGVILSAVDDLKTYQDFTKAHLDGLKNLTSAFESLYDSMSADQKKNADQVFHSFGPSKSAQQG